MRSLQFGKSGGSRHAFVADHRKELGSHTLTLQRQRSRFEQGTVGQQARRRFGYQNVEIDVLAGGFDARGNVDGIANCRVIETGLGPHIADAGEPRMDADPYPDPSRVSETEGIVAIEAGQGFPHAESRSHGLAGMIGDIDGGIPEGHDRVSDELVERAFIGDDMVAERIEQRVQKRDDGARAHLLANLGKVSHVDEHDRQLAFISPEAQGIARMLDAME